jgi:hypothetical protein
MPFIAWSPVTDLPLYLRYRSNVQYDPRAQLRSTPEIINQLDAFVGTCRSRYAAQSGQPKLRSWLLTGKSSLEAAARPAMPGCKMRYGSRRASRKNSFRFDRSARGLFVPLCFRRWLQSFLWLRSGPGFREAFLFNREGDISNVV